MAKDLGSDISPRFFWKVCLQYEDLFICRLCLLCCFLTSFITDIFFRNELVGYGFTHVPSSPGLHDIEVYLLVLCFMFYFYLLLCFMFYVFFHPLLCLCYMFVPSSPGLHDIEVYLLVWLWIMFILQNMIIMYLVDDKILIFLLLS